MRLKALIILHLSQPIIQRKCLTFKKTVMKKLILPFLIIICFNSFGQQTEKKMNKPTTDIKHKQIVKIVNFSELQKILHKNDNKLYVVNFWATWCKPCVAELPGFMEVDKSLRNNPSFKMVLVNMDIANEIDITLKPFLLKNNIQTDVYLLDDNKRMNEWIPAIDKKWSGAIPATVFYRNGKKLKFRESSIEKKELVQIINNYL